MLGSFDEGSLVGAIGAAVKLKVSTQNIHVYSPLSAAAAACMYHDNSCAGTYQSCSSCSTNSTTAACHPPWLLVCRASSRCHQQQRSRMPRKLSRAARLLRLRPLLSLELSWRCASPQTGAATRQSWRSVMAWRCMALPQPQLLLTGSWPLCLCAWHQPGLPPACCCELHLSLAGPDLTHNWTRICCLGLPRGASCCSIAGGQNRITSHCIVQGHLLCALHWQQWELS